MRESGVKCKGVRRFWIEKKDLDLGEFLNEIKEQIRKSEDEITPKREDIINTELQPPNPKEARDLYFRTQEVEIETSIVRKKGVGGKAQFFVVQFGGQYTTEKEHRVKIRMVSQGHRFPARAKG